MCQPELIATEVTPKSWSHQKQILQGIHTKSLEAWRDELEPWEIATMERVAGSRLQSFGYELSGIGGRAPVKPVAQVVKLHLDYRRQLAARRRKDRRDIWNSDQPLAALLTTGQLEAAAQPQPDVPVLRAASRRPPVHPPGPARAWDGASAGCAALSGRPARPSTRTTAPPD